MDLDQTRLFVPGSSPQQPTPTFVFHPSSNGSPSDVDETGSLPADIDAQAEPATTMSTPQAAWMTPTSQGLRQPSATIHEGFSYSMGEPLDGLTAWDPSSLPMQQTPTSDSMSRPISMHQDFYPTDNNWVQQKTCDDSLELQLDSEMNIGQAYTTDEAIPIIDLRYTSGVAMDGEPLQLDGTGLNPRRLSGSSFTMSTSGGLSDMPSYEDFSAALSDAPSFTSDYLPPSNRNSLMSSTQLSPVASPRMTPQTRSELVRTASRGRASPSPRPTARSAPYTVEGPRSGSNKRWSTGSYVPAPSRRPSPFVYYGSNVGSTAASGHELFGPRLGSSSSHPTSSPTIGSSQLPLNLGNLQQAAAAASAAGTPPSSAPFFLPSNAAVAASGYARHSMLLPTQLPSQAGGAMNPMSPMTPMGYMSGPVLDNGFHYHPGLQPPPIPSQHRSLGLAPHGMPLFGHAPTLGSNVGPGSSSDTPAVLSSTPAMLPHGLFRMLQSNGDPHTLHGHYTDLSEPPDLYASLHDEQMPPPPEDMNPADPDMVPHEQELRFAGDLYTPRWVRGHGNKREGWCGICRPGRWLVLKNSAFWYDKSFTHGVSAATGNPFQEPQEIRRMDGNPDVWEGLCGSCNEWIALVSSKKKGTTWFRHAYKCHTHPKVKDAPKRRRESNHVRVAGLGCCGGSGNGNTNASSGVSLVKPPADGLPSVHPSVQIQSSTPSPCPCPGYPGTTTPQPQYQALPGTTTPPMMQPQAPLTPQMTPVAGSAVTATSMAMMPVTSTPTSVTSVPLDMGMAMGLSSVSMPMAMMTTAEQSPRESPLPSQQLSPLPFPHPPPSQPAPPPLPQKSQLRFQNQMAHIEAMQQRHMQTPRSSSSRPMMPMTPVEGLGGMI